jgi:hypothetical protein
MWGLSRDEDERPSRATGLGVADEDDVLASEDVEGFRDPVMDVQGRPEVGWPSASRSVNVPWVPSSVALTDIENPPRSMSLPSPG